jgi:predicted enzyme related to lactoylglutathione lyase
MSNIIAMIANVSVPDLESAIPLYQQIAGIERVKRFSYKNLKLASVGPFLLIEGSLDQHIPQVATILVHSAAEARIAVEAAGGVLLEGPDIVPNGTRVLLKHPDGSVFEFLQPQAT